MGIGFSFGMIKYILVLDRGGGWKTLIINELNATVIYTSKWLILCHVNFT